jgi:hypothetical protein
MWLISSLIDLSTRTSEFCRGNEAARNHTLDLRSYCRGSCGFNTAEAEMSPLTPFVPDFYLGVSGDD